MKAAQQTSVLVMDGDGTLAGIFTDRDLMLRLNAPARSAVTWETPVRAVMTPHVVTLPLSLIHLAPEMMASKNIRHIPIVADGKDPSRPVILGMLTMESIFKANVRLARAWKSVSEVQKSHGSRVGVFTEDMALLAGVSGMLAQDDSYVMRPIRRAELLVADRIQYLAESLDWIILDIDPISIRRLATILLALNRGERVKRILLLCSPDKQEDRGRLILKALQSVPRYKVLPKPIEGSDLVEYFAAAA